MVARAHPEYRGESPAAVLAAAHVRSPALVRLRGTSARWAIACLDLCLVAEKDAPVWLNGPSGSGKEDAARAIHELSPRSEAPVRVVNCAALDGDTVISRLFGHRRGAFTGATADHPRLLGSVGAGTLILDEAHLLPPQVQGMLLRVLQTGEYVPLGCTEARRTAARFVLVTNVCLLEEVRAGRFRADLYDRVAVLQVSLPPLHERLEDLDDIVRGLVSRVGDLRGTRVAPDAIDALRALRPSSVREVQALLITAATFSGVERPVLRRLDIEAAARRRPMLRAEDPAPRVATGPAVEAGSTDEHDADGRTAARSPDRRWRHGRRRYLRLLERHGGNQSATARALGIPRTTFRYHLEQLGLVEISAMLRAKARTPPPLPPPQSSSALGSPPDPHLEPAHPHAPAPEVVPRE